MSDQSVDILAGHDSEFTAMDAGTHVFGSSEAYTNFMDRFVTGEFGELNTPEPGAIGVYLDQEGNVVHVGRVRNGPLGTTLERSLIVYHKITGEPTGLFTYSYQFPFEGIDKVLWVKDPFEGE